MPQLTIIHSTSFPFPSHPPTSPSSSHPPHSRPSYCRISLPDHSLAITLNYLFQHSKPLFQAEGFEVKFPLPSDGTILNKANR
jgi:hypothetical protein